ncbi:MAG: hypothetical protein ABFS12_15930 [Bacteroidota bacterium]
MIKILNKIKAKWIQANWSFLIQNKEAGTLWGVMPSINSGWLSQ